MYQFTQSENHFCLSVHLSVISMFSRRLHQVTCLLSFQEAYCISPYNRENGSQTSCLILTLSIINIKCSQAIYLVLSPHSQIIPIFTRQSLISSDLRATCVCICNMKSFILLFSTSLLDFNPSPPLEQYFISMFLLLCFVLFFQLFFHPFITVSLHHFQVFHP